MPEISLFVQLCVFCLLATVVFGISSVSCMALGKWRMAVLGLGSAAVSGVLAAAGIAAAIAVECLAYAAG